MDEKQRIEESSPLKHQPHSSSMNDQMRLRWHESSSPRRDRTFRRLCIAVCLILACWTLTHYHIPHLLESEAPGSQRTTEDEASQTSNENNTSHVVLEAFIMSKCPDARACIQELVVPAMEKLSDKIEFEMDFIGR
jgi:hypothetical protein